ncbi:hypothetical protein SDC9_118724 [bioreactor metagenome]|uniref:Uncharacterized protein n=1 Tax=bioreactor metagenome TaxID=1076179 RepID=A0A645C883_9ZZZZ
MRQNFARRTLQMRRRHAGRRRRYRQRQMAGLSGCGFAPDQLAQQFPRRRSLPAARPRHRSHIFTTDPPLFGVGQVCQHQLLETAQSLAATAIRPRQIIIEPPWTPFQRHVFGQVQHLAPQYNSFRSTLDPAPRTVAGHTVAGKPPPVIPGPDFQLKSVGIGQHHQQRRCRAFPQYAVPVKRQRLKPGRRRTRRGKFQYQRRLLPFAGKNQAVQIELPHDFTASGLDIHTNRDKAVPHHHAARNLRLAAKRIGRQRLQLRPDAVATPVLAAAQLNGLGFPQPVDRGPGQARQFAITPGIAQNPECRHAVAGGQSPGRTCRAAVGRYLHRLTLKISSIGL